MADPCSWEVVTLRYAGWFLAVIPLLSVAAIWAGDTWSRRAYHLGDAAAIARLDDLGTIATALLFALFLAAPALLLIAALRGAKGPGRRQAGS